MDKNWKQDTDTESLLPGGAQSRNRRKIHRRPRSMLQTFVIGSIGITVVFLLLYIPLFSHYNARICKFPALANYYPTCTYTANFQILFQIGDIILPEIRLITSFQSKILHWSIRGMFVIPKTSSSF